MSVDSRSDTSQIVNGVLFARVQALERKDYGLLALIAEQAAHTAMAVHSAMLIIFQTMLQEDWTPLMYYTWDSVSWWTWTYYIFLNLVGPMFAIQLFLVVVLLWGCRFSGGELMFVSSSRTCLRCAQARLR